MKRLFSAKQMQAADKQAIKEGISALALMQNAGKAVAKLSLQEFPKAKKVLILCGKGNNGGDGYVVGKYLLDKGINVTLLEQSQSPSSKEATVSRNNYLVKGKSKNLNQEQLAKELKKTDLVIDAIFGSGLSRALSGEIAKIIELINASKKPVLSIDIPSGISADSAEIIGKHLNADITVQLAGAKIASAFYPAKYAFGKTRVVNIAIPKHILKAESSICLLDTKTAKTFLPQRKADAHKYKVGTVLLIAGSADYTGAAELASRASLRAGAGLVTLASTHRFQNSWPEIIFKKLSAKNTLAGIKNIDEKYAAVRVIGPGLSNDIANLVKDIIPLSTKPSVIDASALANHKQWLDAVKTHGKCILTPHFGEAAALLETSSQEIAKDPIKTALAISKKFHAITVLKSATTVISDGNLVYLSTAGHPGMATAGSGDVLAGVIGAFVAQADNILRATAAAVYIHGKAGELAARKYGNGLVAGDLVNSFAKVWKDLSLS